MGLKAVVGRDGQTYASPTFTGTVNAGSDNAVDIGTASVGFKTGYFDTSVVTPTINAASGTLSITTSSGNIAVSPGGGGGAVFNCSFSFGHDAYVLNFGTASDAVIARAAANSFVFGSAAASAGAACTRAEINKAVTAFTDAVAKTVLTITIPNAAHSASILVRVTGSLGAGGAIGANEATATNAYIVSVTRTAGVNAAASISAAFGAAATAVAGANTVTAVATLAAVSGAVGATNTIDIQVTITKNAGASANHTAVVTASLLNANATGVTIA